MSKGRGLFKIVIFASEAVEFTPEKNFLDLLQGVAIFVILPFSFAFLLFPNQQETSCIHLNHVEPHVKRNSSDGKCVSFFRSECSDMLAYVTNLIDFLY